MISRCCSNKQTAVDIISRSNVELFRVFFFVFCSKTCVSLDVCVPSSGRSCCATERTRQPQHSELVSSTSFFEASQFLIVVLDRLGQAAQTEDQSNSFFFGEERKTPRWRRLAARRPSANLQLGILPSLLRLRELTEPSDGSVTDGPASSMTAKCVLLTSRKKKRCHSSHLTRQKYDWIAFKYVFEDF